MKLSSETLQKINGLKEFEINIFDVLKFSFFVLTPALEFFLFTSSTVMKLGTNAFYKKLDGLSTSIMNGVFTKSVLNYNLESCRVTLFFLNPENKFGVY